MTRTAKAVVYRERNQPVSVEEIEVESPRQGEVMIRVAACGVCHSDLSATNGTIPVPPNTVLGHEGAGTVVEIGEGVTDLAEGDPVMVSWIPMCRECTYCLAGKPWLCERPAKHGPLMPDGTSRLVDRSGSPLNHFMSSAVMAEYATLPRQSVVRIDGHVPFECAALVGCAVATGVGAVFNTARIEPGSTVAVIGTGGVGLNAIQGAVIAGARAVVAVDTSDEKLEFARAFGASLLVNPAKGDPVDQVKKLLGSGVDYAIECIGLGETVQQAFNMLKKGGKAVVVGIAPVKQELTLRPVLLPVTEKTLTGSMYGSVRPWVDFPKLLALYQAGRLKLDELVTKKYAIEDVNTAFADMKRNARGVIMFD